MFHSLLVSKSLCKPKYGSNQNKFTCENQTKTII